MTVMVTMTSQDSPRTARVTMTSWETLPRSLLGARQTMTSQGIPRIVSVAMTSRDTLPREMLGLRH